MLRVLRVLRDLIHAAQAQAVQSAVKIVSESLSNVTSDDLRTQEHINNGECADECRIYAFNVRCSRAALVQYQQLMKQEFAESISMSRAQQQEANENERCLTAPI